MSQSLPQTGFATTFSPEVVDLIAQKNCENLSGSVEIPFGLAGPVLVKHFVSLEHTSSSDAMSSSDPLSFPRKRESSVSEEFSLPLATSEGALVASVSRGCKAIRLSGGAGVFVKKIGMSRAPVFKCVSGASAQEFANWLDQNIKEFSAVAEATSHHLKYLSHLTWIRGRFVFVRFVFDTGEAMGMNMVSIALQKAWEVMSIKLPSELASTKLISLSSNVCCDKKDSQINRLMGRGYWAQAEVILTKEVINTVLKTTPQELWQAHYAKNLIGTNVAGSLSQNMQVSNVIAAMYLATGQDMAHVTEGSQANTTVEIDGENIYFAVTLPNLNLGTVGGGTWLPKQTQARKLIRSGKDINAAQLTAAVAVGCLAGEISGLAALASNTLAAAHERLGRIKGE